MKKIISIVLAIVMMCSMFVPVFAVSGPSVENKTPVVYISGDSNELWYDNETKKFAIEDMLAIYKNSEDGNIKEAAFNILYPLIVKGVLFDEWDDYYEAVYNELSDVYEPIKLDKNGNIPEDSDCGISTAQKNDLARAKYENRKSWKGTYTEKAYNFHYDWRLDPMELADQLHDYIEDVCAGSGHEQVSISVKCLGCNVLLAYIYKYPEDSAKRLKGVGIDVATSMGADFLSGIVSGKFGIDGNSISRLATDLSERNNMYTDIARFATSTIDLLTNTGVIDTLTEVAKEQLYVKIEYGIISALALSTFMTFPCYWALVTTEDFDNALNYVFGPEGGEKREEYKGLIEKITYYNDTIKKNVLPIMKTLEENGTNICVISKYGNQMVPVLKDGSIVGDEYVSAYRSSFGATTSNIYTTLSDEYIAQQNEKGLGRYISPDKQIDASTCLFPDYTWFFKGVSHGYYTRAEANLLMTVIDADRQLTIDDFDWTQFIVYDYQTDIAEPMTEENCHNEYWEADEKTDHPQTKQEKLVSFLKSLFRWIKSLFELIISRAPKAE